MQSSIDNLLPAKRSGSASWSTSINGDTRIVVIVADPVTRVKSPEFFNAHFAQHGINAVLVPAHVNGDGLQEAFRGLAAVRNLAGVVVTVPHKVTASVLPGVRLTERAEAIGAINCVRRLADGGWLGDNFDGTGFVSGLEQQGVSLAGKQALLVGAAGGAGRALSNALCSAGVGCLRMSDINGDKASTLRADLQKRYGRVRLETTAAVAAAGDDLVINASPAGMRTTDPCPVDISHVGENAVVADLIMKPEKTVLLERAASKGLKIHPGRHLLLSSVEHITRFLGLQT